MLNQIIYTRCLPYRDIKRNGQVVRGDGFGVFSLSPEVFDQCSVEELTYINNRLAIPNAARENAAIGLFNSYEYVLLPSGQGVLTYEVARPLCKEPRKNGRLHRSGNFIKQSLIGHFSRRVTDLMESDIWNAYKTSEIDYYMDDVANPEPPMLPTIDECVFDIGITNESVDQFICDGRKELIQKGISFILRELGKPESERKVLFIKDEPQNVVMWILAILRIFPEKIANKITFSTNKSRLGTQTDSLLFYYTDKSNKIYFMQNKTLELKRHPYCMIVGYHPADAFCTSLRQNANSNYYILDGTAYTTTIPDSYNLSASFCNDSALFIKEYRFFSDTVLASVPESAISEEIDKLYNAYKYVVLEDVSRWTYSELLKHLQTLSQYGVLIDNELNNYLVDKVMSFIQDHLSSEIDSDFSISSVLWMYTEKNQESVKLIKTLSEGIWESYQSGYSITKIWNCLKDISNNTLYMTLLVEIFSNNALPNIYDNFSKCSAEEISIFFEMFCEKLRLTGESERAIRNDDEMFNFALYAINELRISPVYASKCLKMINRDHELFVEIATLVAKNFEEVNSVEANKWWEIVTESAGESILSLCKHLINANGVQLMQIEQLLCYSVSAKKTYDEDICRAFIDSKRIVHGDCQSGDALFSLLINYSDVRDYAKLIRNIRFAKLDRVVEEKLFHLIDKKLDIPTPGIDNANIASEMRNWGRTLQKVSLYNVSFLVWQKTIYEKSVVSVQNILRSYVKYRMPYKDKYKNTQWYNDILDKTLSFEDGALNMLMICFFRFRSAEIHEQYIKWYVQNTLRKADKRELINTMLSISNALCYDFKIFPYNEEEMNVIRKVIEDSFIRELVPYYSNSMFSKVEKNKNFDDKTKSKMIFILREVEAKKPASEHRGILGSIFRK